LFKVFLVFSSFSRKKFFSSPLSEEDEAFWGRQLLEMGSGTSMPLNTKYLRGESRIMPDIDIGK
jgi:hypothetical protein